MNDWNQLESLCRSWTPRTPSPKLKARVFAVSDETAPRPAAIMPLLARFVVPAAVCMFMVIAAVGSRTNHFGAFMANSTNSFLEVASRPHPDYAAYLAGEGHSDRNSTHSTFEWTMAAPSTSSMGSFFSLTTNTVR